MGSVDYLNNIFELNLPSDYLFQELELVVRYGIETDNPIRLFAEFGHYSALLDWDNNNKEIINFMKNQNNKENLIFYPKF